MEILGVGFDTCSIEEAVAYAEQYLTADNCGYVVTPNPEIVEICREREDVRRIVNAACLVLPDGIGIIYGAKILGRPIRERVPGIEFGERMIERCTALGKRVFLLGAKPGVAELAAQKLSEKYQGLQIVGTHDGYFQDDEAVLEEIRSTRTDMLLVCLGAPKQELWMGQYAKRTGAKLLIGLGGSLDVFAGVVERAPAFYREHHLEWFYRLMKEPKRIKRAWKLPLFLLHTLSERLRGR